jgi:hypothetical protein
MCITSIASAGNGTRTFLTKIGLIRNLNSNKTTKIDNGDSAINSASNSHANGVKVLADVQPKCTNHLLMLDALIMHISERMNVAQLVCQSDVKISTQDYMHRKVIAVKARSMLKRVIGA